MLAEGTRALSHHRATWLPLMFLAVAAIAGGLIGQLSAVLGVGVVLGLAGAVAVLVSDELTLLAIIATITLLPFGTLPIKVGLSPTFLDLLCAILLVRWLGRRVRPGASAAPATPLDLVVWAWLALAVVALLAASGRTALTADTLHYFVKVVLATLVFFFVVDVVRRPEQLQRLYVALCVGGALEALVGIGLYVLHPGTATHLLNLLGVFHYPTGSDVLRYRVDFNQAERAIATSVDPNVLGGLLMVALTLTLAQLPAQRPILPRLWTVILAAPMALCMLLTYSRGAWVGILIAFLFLGIWRYRRLLAAGVVALLVFVQLPISRRFTRQLYSGLQAKDKAAAMRLGEIHDALRLINTYPAFGVGFGGSPDQNLYVGVSNIYLLMAEEMGVVGLLVFLLAVAIFYVWLLYSLPKIQDAATNALTLGIIAATVGVFAAAMLDRYFFSFQHDIALLWLLLGLGAAAARIGRAPRPAPAPAPASVARPALAVDALQPARR